MIRAFAHRFINLSSLRPSARPVLVQAHGASKSTMALIDLASLPEELPFGRFSIPKSQIFAATEHSYAFVNLKPIVPGHVLISPRRVEAEFAGLDASEVADLWQLAQKVSACMQTHHKADSMSLVIQDGPAAGQTVPHVHVHCLPRHFADFEPNDKVYDRIDQAEAEESAARQRKPIGGVDDEQRVPRTIEAMAAEAAEFQKLMQGSK